MFPDNAMADDKITSTIIDSEIMFPEGTGCYIAVYIYHDDIDYNEVFRITADGIIVKNGITALGVKEISKNTPLYDSDSEDFKCFFDRLNRLRVTFSSTNNKVGIQLNRNEARYTIADTDEYNFASQGAYKVCLSVGYSQAEGKDLGAYMKNTKAYTVYRNSSSKEDREAVADRLGVYKYRYSDGSGDFLFSKVIDGTKNTGKAVITGLDPNKCTREIEEPVETEYTIPAMADGYAVTEIKEAALEGLGLKKLIIENDIVLNKNSLKGTADEIVFLGNVVVNGDPFGGQCANIIYCTDKAFAELEPYLSYSTRHSVPWILTAYYSADNQLVDLKSAFLEETLMQSPELISENNYNKTMFVWCEKGAINPLVETIKIDKTANTGNSAEY